MRVAVVYQYYQGVAAPGHSLVYELTQFLADRGHEVTVVSGETGYMQRDKPALPWYRRIFRREVSDRVQVIRTFTYSELHRSFLGRLLGLVSFSLSCPLGLLAVRKPDVVLASSPPLFPVFAAWLICRIRGIPFVFEVRDLWPASAVQMGLVRSRALIAVMAWMERVLYNRSARIVALTEGIREDICARGWARSKVEVVTCGVDFDQIHPDPEGAQRVRQQQGWQGKKVVMYFGALGIANNLPVILRAAERMKNVDDVLFVLIGDGIRRAYAEAEIARRSLPNVRLLPPVPKAEARTYISAADICLVTLQDIPLFQGAIPTKLVDYMACGRPVLCGVRGEAQKILEQAGSGAAFEPDDDVQLAGLIQRCLSDPAAAAKMGESGLAYARAHFSASAARHAMERILAEVAAEAHGRKVGGA